MQSVNTSLTNITPDATTAQPNRVTFSQETIDAVQYFFARLKMIYGTSKFATHWPTDVDLKMAKREWAYDIARHSKEELDAALDNAKKHLSERDWSWPNIGLILSGAKNNNPAHQLFLPEPERNLESAEERAKRARSLRQELGL